MEHIQKKSFFGQILHPAVPDMSGIFNLFVMLLLKETKLPPPLVACSSIAAPFLLLLTTVLTTVCRWLTLLSGWHVFCVKSLTVAG